MDIVCKPLPISAILFLSALTLVPSFGVIAQLGNRLGQKDLILNTGSTSQWLCGLGRLLNLFVSHLHLSNGDNCTPASRVVMRLNERLMSIACKEPGKWEILQKFCSCCLGCSGKHHHPWQDGSQQRSKGNGQEWIREGSCGGPISIWPKQQSSPLVLDRMQRSPLATWEKFHSEHPGHALMSSQPESDQL